LIGRRAAFIGISATRPVRFASQHAASGQVLHSGRSGVQTNDPTSISAWLNFPGCRCGTSAAAISQIGSSPAADPSGPSWPASRAITRRELASTIGSGRSNAIEAIAPAV
jgi:hypothetical protein